MPSIDITLSKGALNDIPDVLERLGLGGSSLVVSDKRTLAAAGKATEGILSSKGIDAARAIVEGEPPHADIPSAETICAAGKGKDFLVACGAGTVNDLTKYAAARLGVPYICVPTAPSMNGYPSSIVAITRDGFKTADSAPVAAAIVADTDIFANCPHDMVLAGLGDLLSKNVSGADWWLSHHVVDDYFCELPLNMVANTMSWASGSAPAIANGDEKALAELMENLLVSGLSMTVAGVSRPSSGGEHLISHMWDMCHMDAAERLELHGIQVGVSTLITARLFERLISLDRVDMDKARDSYRDPDSIRRDIENYHGNRAGVVWEEFKPKLPSEKRLEWIASTWDVIREKMDRYAAPSSKLESIMKEAGARTMPAEVGMGPEEVRQSIVHGREIRNRYTILDLAADLGLLEELISLP